MQQGADDLADASSGLLVAGDPDPVAVENMAGSSPFVLLGDHAGRAIPRRLGDLGVGAADLERHIAWDIGVAAMGSAIAERLDAIFVHQRYSRLVIDCNRAPGDPGSIAPVSDKTAIPGNQTLSDDDREDRRRAIFQPYQDRIGRILSGRVGSGQPTVLVSLHSFTPSMDGLARPWRFGVLHRGDSAFSRAVLAVLTADWGEAAGDNQPYAMDGIDYTIPHHADSNGLDYLELEVRQDLLATSRQQGEVADIVVDVLRRAAA